MLHGRRIERLADCCDHIGSGIAVITEHADLDQFVAFQADVDFTQHFRRQAGIADHDHRLQMMCPGFEGTAFGGSQGFHGIYG